MKGEPTPLEQASPYWSRSYSAPWHLWLRLPLPARRALGGLFLIAAVHAVLRGT